jgi:hypothetical protein
MDKQGWVLIVDDDDYLANPTVIFNLMNVVKFRKDMVIHQMQYEHGGGILPQVYEFKKQPRLGRIGSACIMVHTNTFKAIRWDGWKCADFRYIMKAWKITEHKRYVAKPLIKIGGGHNLGNLGNKQDIKLVHQPAKKKLGKFDSIVLICTYNRYEKVNNILADLYNQKTDYTFKPIIVDDASTEKEYSQLKKDYPEIDYIRLPKNNGKKQYWQTVTLGLKKSNDYDYKYLIQLDDDFILTDNFLNKLIKIHEKNHSKDNRYVATSFHLTSNRDRDKTRWNMKFWIDGGGLYRYDFLKMINFQVDYISPMRWKNKTHLSSGVWQQISRKINRFGYKIFKTKKSLVYHDGNEYSVMGRKKRVNDAINTFNFEKNNE